ncbi:olfactory receptor 11G2-like [Suricata suricatta]|uniref:olfactory receptor 11G2-like n=1 Tax=Suricata suricatta TaxID=37032 RepID=UPI001155F3A4|nr:olfactory receptor 11G2-like [Suricata suricatta]
MNISNTPNTSSTITGFILLGFPCSREGQILFFVLFSVVYLLTLMGNGSIICAVRWDQSLHTPMYILLANFSFLEIWYVTSTVPNMLANFLSDTKAICDPGPLLALTCTRTPVIELTSSTLSSLLLFIPFFFIVVSYALVLRAVLRVPSAAGQRKAFSTCGSHLAVVSLFYGSVMVMYVSPTSEHEAGIQKVVTLFYSVVTPLINPIIYSLRNKEMKHAMKKLLRTQKKKRVLLPSQQEPDALTQRRSTELTFAAGTNEYARDREKLQAITLLLLINYI